VRVAVLVAFAAAFVLTACSAPKRVYTFRELKAGKHSHYPMAQGRVFKNLDEFRRFASGVRALEANSEFPADLPGVDWTREMVIALFAGPSDTSQRVSFIRAGELGGTLAVFWRREKDIPDAVFPDEVVDLTPDPDPATPFLVGTLPRSERSVNFIQNQKVQEPP
jgi:hypothetical protein